MDHTHLQRLQHQHPAWRLLKAQNAPLIIGFFHQAFIVPGTRALSQSVLEEKLQDHLFRLRQAHGPHLYPGAARDYAAAWSTAQDGQHAYLRKYYPRRQAADHSATDEPYFDLTPASEKAVEWIISLQPRGFVGTESRLRLVLETLRELAKVASANPAQRINALRQQRDRIDQEIHGLESGRFTPGSPRQVQEHLFQADDAARTLLSDFRQIEENFRKLDREARERIATADTAKGRLLDTIFDDRDQIAASNQGQSFAAFWGLMMSPDLQQELNDLINLASSLDQDDSLGREPLLPSLYGRLLDAGEKAKQTHSRLAEQLRRFLDDRMWLENRRIAQLIHDIETQALQTAPPAEEGFFEIAGVRPSLRIPLARGLYEPSRPTRLNTADLLAGNADFDDALLLQIHHVDEGRLRQQIQQTHPDRARVSLAEVCQAFPIDQGLAEVVAYVRMASVDDHAVIREDTHDALRWTNDAGDTIAIDAPRIVFTR